MKKRLLSIFCALVLLAGAVPSAAALEGEAARAADTLAALGLVKGYDGGYALNEPATRAQAAVLLVRLAGAEQEAARTAASAGFRTAPAWARSSISYISKQGWTSSTTAQAFHPDSAITADDWCTLLLRMLGYSDRDGDFAAERAAVFAQHIGLVSRSYSGPLLRGDLFQAMGDALTFPYKGSGETVAERLVQKGVCSRASAGALGLLSPELTARQAADRYSAAVFCLNIYAAQGDIALQIPYAHASGFFISADGLAVTNYHSIEGAAYAAAILSTGETYAVESVVWGDPDADLAVLRISRTSTDGRTASAFSALEMAGTEDLRAGDTVYALGNPLGMGLAVSSGIISAVARDVDSYTLPCIMNTADISRGSSGGALLNVYGQVIGVTSGAFTYGNSMYLAVPVAPLMEADLSGEGLTLQELSAQEKNAF